MITYTCSDVIRQAKIAGNVSNVNISNFDLSTTLLNSEYQKLYDKIVMSNGANVKQVEMAYEPFVIPEDCYHIIGVYRNKRLVQKSTLRQDIPGTYKIENNVILCQGPITVRYSTLPQTLTAPDEPERLDVEIKECGLVTDNGFYYKDNENKELYYDFSSESKTEKTFKSESNRFLSSTLTYVNNEIIYNNVDVTHIFERDEAGIKSVRVSDPYVVINYEDGKSFIYYGFEGGDQLNWNEHKGKETYGEVLGFTTNDVTGKGCIWRDENGEIYYMSFTPDTVLNYPSNTFFQLLIYKLAAALTSLNGVQNNYLIDILIPEAEVAFQEHLSKDRISTRMNNDIL